MAPGACMLDTWHSRGATVIAAVSILHGYSSLSVAALEASLAKTLLDLMHVDAGAAGA